MSGSGKVNSRSVGKGGIRNKKQRHTEKTGERKGPSNAGACSCLAFEILQLIRLAVPLFSVSKGIAALSDGGPYFG